MTELSLKMSCGTCTHLRFPRAVNVTHKPAKGCAGDWLSWSPDLASALHLTSLAAEDSSLHQKDENSDQMVFADVVHSTMVT